MDYKNFVMDFEGFVNESKNEDLFEMDDMYEMDDEYSDEDMNEEIEIFEAELAENDSEFLNEWAEMEELNESEGIDTVHAFLTPIVEAAANTFNIGVLEGLYESVEVLEEKIKTGKVDLKLKYPKSNLKVEKAKKFISDKMKDISNWFADKKESLKKWYDGKKAKTSDKGALAKLKDQFNSKMDSLKAAYDKKKASVKEKREARRVKKDFKKSPREARAKYA